MSPRGRGESASDEDLDEESGHGMSIEAIAQAASSRIQQQRHLQRAQKLASRRYNNTGRYVLAPFLMFIFSSLLVLYLSPLGDDPTMFPVIGGVLGLISSSYVMVAYLFGSSKTCTIFNGHDNQNLCSVPSAMFEFFEMASEMWFLCIAFDLLISISNPFSTFKSRMKYYHTFVWIMATVFALPVGVDNKIGGYWYVKGKQGFVDTSCFCWLKMQIIGADDHPVTSWVPWVFFYIPLISIYLFSACVLYFAYGRLKKGVSNTFVHRLRVLVINSINLSSCFLYWLCLLVVYGSVYAAANTDLQGSQFLLKLLRYLIPAKGVSGVIVWVLVMSIDIEGLGGIRDQGDEDSMIDLNTALRQEVLLYSQGGIQVCTRHMAEKKEEYETREKLTTYLSHGITHNRDDTFTPWFFLRLILGFQDQIDKVAELLSNKDIRMKTALQQKRDSLTERPAYLSDMVRNLVSNGAESDADGRPDSLRMSQRPTVVMGSGPGAGSGSVTPPHSSPSSRLSPDGTKQVPSSLMQETTERDDSMDERPSDDQLGNLPSAFATASLRSQINLRAGSDIEMAPFGSTVEPGREGQYPGASAPRSSYPGGGAGYHDSMAQDGARPNFVFAKEELAEENTSRITSLWDLNFSHLAKWASKACLHLVGAYTGVGDAVLRENDQVSFTEFKPYLFRRIRLAAGLTDEMYAEQFKKTIKERLTQGGSSGAFFFFSKDESLIAKSCTEEELENLTSSAKHYSDYICENSKSFISRIYGVYRLRIYGTSLHFFVMNNIFLNERGHPPDELEKYDLKGSWVARNAALPRPGDKVTCKLCYQKFIYRKKRRKLRVLVSSPPPTVPSTPQQSREVSTAGLDDPGPALGPGDRVASSTLSPILSSALSKRLGSLSLRALGSPVSGLAGAPSDGGANGQPLPSQSPDDCPVSPLRVHEAALILKDNDLKSKLYLPPDKAREVLEQLRKDADFLRRIKVMDYSLLMGVHYTSYLVDNDDVEAPTSQSDVIPPQEALNMGAPHTLASFSTPPTADGNGAFGPNSPVTPGSNGDPIGRKRALTAKRSSLPFALGANGGQQSGTGALGGSSPDSRRIGSVQSPLSAVGAAAFGQPALGAGPETLSPYARPYEVSRVVGPDCYYMGIIDFQQRWTLSKRFERLGKILFKGADADGLSAMPPEQYMQRFVDHMEDLLELEQGEAQRPAGRPTDRTL